MSSAVTTVPNARVRALNPATSTVFRNENLLFRNTRPINQSTNADQKVPAHALRQTSSDEINGQLSDDAPARAAEIVPAPAGWWIAVAVSVPVGTAQNKKTPARQT